MLALKDSDHVVRYDSFKLARRANLTEQEVIDALKVLSSPDTKRLIPQEHDGRRILPVEGGWLLVNGEKYQSLMAEVRLRMQKARWAAKNRHKQKEEEDGVEPEPEPEFALKGEKVKKPKPEPNGDHAKLIKMWCEAYQEKFKSPYVFSDGRDGKSVKILLESGWTPDQVIAKAKAAWAISPNNGGSERCWSCVNRSSTLHGFAETANKIVEELQHESKRLKV